MCPLCCSLFKLFSSGRTLSESLHQLAFQLTANCLRNVNLGRRGVGQYLTLSSLLRVDQRCQQHLGFSRVTLFTYILGKAWLSSNDPAWTGVRVTWMDKWQIRPNLWTFYSWAIFKICFEKTKSIHGSSFVATFLFRMIQAHRATFGTILFAAWSWMKNKP